MDLSNGPDASSDWQRCANAFIDSREGRAGDSACKVTACRLVESWGSAMAWRLRVTPQLHRCWVQIVGQPQHLQKCLRLRAAPRGLRHSPGRPPPAGPGLRRLEIVRHGCAAARGQRSPHICHVRLCSAAPVPAHACKAADVGFFLVIC